MRLIFNSPQEVKEAAERNAAIFYRNHVEKGHDLNPYSTQGARAEFDRYFEKDMRYSWEGDPDWDYLYQLGRAMARIVDLKGNKKMKTEIQEMIEQAKSLGLKVYAPENLTTYFYVTRDNLIGYAQYSRVGGASFSTVHKPNRDTGTGFNADSLEKSLQQSPVAQNYKSFAEFKNQHWQNLIEY